MRKVFLGHNFLVHSSLFFML